MSKAWAADVEISTEQAARLIARQFPDLAGLPVELIGVGWDNSAFLVDEKFVFRLPRRKIGADLVDRESRFLPGLAASLDLPISAPTFLGQPEGDYPYPFAGYPYIPGTTACQFPWTDAQRAGNALPLARFLAQLHRIAVTSEAQELAPRDDIGRIDLNKRVPMFHQRLEAIAWLLNADFVRALHQTADTLAVTPPAIEPPCWVHGDLYARHLLVDDLGRLCGVIDWGDVHLGDKAVDLSIAFSFLPPPARAAFREAYGAVDPDTWERARFRALYYGVVLIEYGHDVGDDALYAVGEYALRAALTP